MASGFVSNGLSVASVLAVKEPVMDGLTTTVTTAWAPGASVPI